MAISVLPFSSRWRHTRSSPDHAGALHCRLGIYTWEMFMLWRAEHLRRVLMTRPLQSCASPLQGVRDRFEIATEAFRVFVRQPVTLFPGFCLPSVLYVVPVQARRSKSHSSSLIFTPPHLYSFSGPALDFEARSKHEPDFFFFFRLKLKDVVAHHPNKTNRWRQLQRRHCFIHWFFGTGWMTHNAYKWDVVVVVLLCM